MWNASHTETVEAKPSAIWQRWTDVARWPEQDDSLESAEISGPFAVGSVITLKPKGSPKVTVRLVDVTPDKSFSSVGQLPLTSLHFDHLIETSGKNVSFTQSVSMDGPLAWLFSSLMGKTMASNLEKRMRKLAELVTR